ncbi:hypothetical protein NLG97_g331 [Lecanicillium saksenae]|uniref:Uncharacterized protein n=1 Tax=Lecanicillium saksenae TaxID=468837 RepID=A0ACC1R6U6_9HYPO|nr:hypothetical protein NLG97_g331 [Lecanicillium saksenae]
MELKAPIMAHKPFRAYEVAFWGLSDGVLARLSASPICPTSVGTRYRYITCLHQGLIEDVFLEELGKYDVQVQRRWTLKDFQYDMSDAEYPLFIQMEHLDNRTVKTVRAKYLFGADGARSIVRDKLGLKLEYQDSKPSTWGVIDGNIQTNFPDTKVICMVQSSQASALIVPRENGMTRLYAVLSSTPESAAEAKGFSLMEIQEAIRRALHPYTVEWDHVEWHSTYPIRQGLAQKYSDNSRVYLGGDACHVHSPKAAQGMNTAFFDAHNLAWKIHGVECGFLSPTVLTTYESERRSVAERLIRFDNRYASLLSHLPQAATKTGTQHDAHNAGSQSSFIKTFNDSGDFVSGYGVNYEENIFNWSPSHPAKNSLLSPPELTAAPGCTFLTSKVTRVEDANVVHLAHAIPVDGSFRIFIFAGNPAQSRVALQDFASNLASQGCFYATSPLRNQCKMIRSRQRRQYQPFSTFATVFASARSEIDISRDVPGLLSIFREHVYADDEVDKGSQTSIPLAHSNVGWDKDMLGAVVVVRPDGYVGATARLVEGAGTIHALNEYFSTFASNR